MRCKVLPIVFAAVLMAANVYAHCYSGNAAMKVTGGGTANKTTIADPAEDYYDMKYVKFDLNFTDTSIYVSGNVSTTAQVVAPTMDVYTFELDSAITIDSVLVNGQPANVQTTGFVRKASLASTLNHNDMFTATVYYHGQPPTGSGFFTGITHSVTGTGVNMVYTVSDPYAGKDWWPCKQSLTDKIDSADIWITVPEGLKAGSNGLLQDVATPASGYEQYQWKTRYAIDYYLLSVAVAPYFDYSYYMHFSGSTDSMLIQNYLYDSATFMPAYKANFDSVGLMVDYFSQLYGRYPFDKEKYGHCFTTLSGGMEHQTMTTIGVTTTPLIAHELGHQWFGDHVTYEPWSNVWLSEGFATYTEQLYVAHFWSEAAMISYRTGQYNYVMIRPGGSVIVNDTTNVDSLFDQRLVYYKAAGVVHMLRYLAQDDSLFFRTLRQYQQQYGFGNATTEDLKAVAAQQYGRNLDTFFNEWVYGQGYPTYSLKWNQAGDQKYLEITQTSSAPASVAVFAMPLKIQLKSAQGDTTVMVYNNQPIEDYTISWADSISSIVIDPNNDIINKTGQIKYDSTVGVAEITRTQIRVYPNPSKDHWQADNLPKGADLILTDMEGRRVWRGSNESTSVMIPGKQLPAGNYLLNVMWGRESVVVKLTHW